MSLTPTPHEASWHDDADKKPGGVHPIIREPTLYERGSTQTLGVIGNIVEFTKSERRQLRELAGEAYEAEAHALLEELDADFSRWREGKIQSSELLAAIHEFHQHQSRELWSMYQGLGDATVVERGISLGLISESKVPPALLTKLQLKS